jgi:thioredoxin-dependent peroxiredoxin
VVLYFYPKDNTPACTTEACNFHDDLQALRALGVQILGVSVGNTESHARFAEKHSLPFLLLADDGGAVAKSYGSLWSLGPIRFAKRHTAAVGAGLLRRVARMAEDSERRPRCEERS